MKPSFLTIIVALCAFAASGANVINLSGKWTIKQTSSDNVTEITLPGSMLTNGIGNIPDTHTKWTGSLYDMSYYYAPRYAKYRESGNIKFPFFLTPDKEYVGVAEYSRKVDIPVDWSGTDITLFLERPHIETSVYVNSHFVGRDSSLTTPHRFNITPFVNPGTLNDIKIVVYNGIENVCVGQDSHSVTDQTQGNWNGIVGKIELQSRPKTHISHLNIFPQLSACAVDVEVKIANPGKKANISLIVDGKKKTYKNLKIDNGAVKVRYKFDGDIKLWDEFSPYLYTIKAVLSEDTPSKTFGMREISIRNRQFYINNRPIWLRGTVENCNFPLTGYPPVDVESWIAIFRKCKEYGINHMRFHSYCPPEAAFEAADIVGLYLQPEGPSWPNHGVLLGNGMTIDKYLLEETRRMVDEYGNHPSFTMLAAGNEPAGNWVEWVGDFVDYWHATGDNRRVYCGASVGGGWAWDPRSDYHVRGGARGLEWVKKAPSSDDDFGEDMLKVVQKGASSTQVFDVNEPRIGHETGQWCAFPDFGEISQYNGVYKPRNFEIFRELLAENGMAGQAEKFLYASGNLQMLAYKYEVERNLRTPDYAGFQLLGLNDYSGQGTALVGILNVFWKEKGYTDAEMWRGFCSPIVPLARFPKFVYTVGEQLTLPIELYNAGSSTLKRSSVVITLTLPDNTHHVVNTMTKDFAIGKNLPVDTVRFDFDENYPIGKYNVRVDIDSVASNSWDFWLYPKSVEMPRAENIYVCDTLDDTAIAMLKSGGNVLLTAAGKVRYGDDVIQHYLPVFWNTSWFKMRPPHTTGVVIESSHPLFKDFPTDDWANLNWWELINRAQVMNLGQFPADYQSPIQPIDTWHINRKLGMIIEGKVYAGKLLMTTMDISSNLERRPVARQMRKAILSYMGSDDFNPAMCIDVTLIRNLYENQADPVKMYTDESPDELKSVLK